MNKYYQIIKIYNGTNVSIRYYPFYACISIKVDSVPALLYGTSQILFENSDFDYLKNIIAELLNEACGINDIEPDVFDEAIITRLDLNQDYYFDSKENERVFRQWLEKFNMPYADEFEYDTGKKKSTKGHNLTVYSKDEQCADKNKTYLNTNGNYCTRLEFQIKNTYFNRNKPIYMKDLFKIKKYFYEKMLSKMLLNDEIMNRRRLDVFLKTNSKSHKSNYCVNLKKFYLDLGKIGYLEMRKKCKSFYHYLSIAKSSKKVPIRLDDEVFKELNTLKKMIYYSCNDWKK